MSKTIIVNGITFKSHPLCMFGDYVNAGSEGHANVRYLEQNLRCKYKEDVGNDSTVECVIVRQAHNNHIAYIREDLFQKYNEMLKDHIVFDESLLSDVEHELEQQAWDCWGMEYFQSDLKRHIMSSVHGGVAEEAEMVLDLMLEDKDLLHKIFFDAIEAHGHGDESRMDGDSWTFQNDQVLSLRSTALDLFRHDLEDFCYDLQDLFSFLDTLAEELKIVPLATFKQECERALF